MASVLCQVCCGGQLMASVLNVVASIVGSILWEVSCRKYLLASIFCQVSYA